MKNENIAIVIAVIAAFFVMSLLTASPFMGYGMMYGYWPFGFGGMFFFMAIIWIAALIALVLFILWLIKQLQPNVKKK